MLGQLTAAIGAARGGRELDHLSQTIWRALSAGALGDDEAQGLAELLHARRMALKGPQTVVSGHFQRPSMFPARRPQRPVRRPEALQRRRRLAASGPLPPALAAAFTVAELAALKVIGDEHRTRGCCDRSIDELAARAGVGRTSVQNAVRQAVRLGLLTQEIRRRDGAKNLPNVLRLVSAEWRQWLDRAAVKRTGFKTLNTTDNKDFSTEQEDVAAARFNPRWRRSGTGSTGQKAMR